MFRATVVSGHRIVSSPAERLTAQQSPDGQCGTFPRSVQLDRTGGVRGTGGGEATSLRQPGGNHFFVEKEKRQKDPRRRKRKSHFGEAARHPAAFSVRSIRALTSGMSARQIARRGMTMILHGLILPCRSRTDSEIRRLARFRTTAFLWKRRLQMTPKRRYGASGNDPLAARSV